MDRWTDREVRNRYMDETDRRERSGGTAPGSGVTACGGLGALPFPPEFIALSQEQEEEGRTTRGAHRTR